MIVKERNVIDQPCQCHEDQLANKTLVIYAMLTFSGAHAIIEKGELHLFGQRSKQSLQISC